jgi:hypothetical protein
MVGSVCHIKWFTTGMRNSLKEEDIEMEVRKWLTTVKRLYAAGVDALVKRWDKCTNVGGGYVEK